MNTTDAAQADKGSATPPELCEHAVTVCRWIYEGVDSSNAVRFIRDVDKLKKALSDAGYRV